METNTNPTDRQQELYNFIKEQIYKRGYGPTVRELCDHFEIRSPNGAVSHLKALQKKGYIERLPNMSRAIRLLKDPSHPSLLPVLGKITAERISMVESSKEEVEIGGAFAGAKTQSLIAVDVRSDALQSELVASGDLLVIDPKSNPRKGQTVLLSLDGNVALKRWVPEKGGKVRLESIYGSGKAVVVKSPEVVGVFVGLVRKSGK
ncbi:MAG: transcriptional repressor LexA [Thermoguttaceae bacterium]|nr:transcriptional repressor LexA [Thermoguttaceae bacterium]